MITVGNGNQLPIKYVGSSFIKGNVKDLILQGLLHVPLICKHLISISRLTMDNFVIVEFYDSFCAIKDKATGKVLLEGTIKDGLYRINTTKGSAISVLHADNGKKWSL